MIRRAQGMGHTAPLEVGPLQSRHRRPPGDAARAAWCCLSAKEFALLATLARAPRRVFSKAELLRDVWGYRGEIRTRTVDSHASRVRRKLAAIHDEFTWIENVWGVGYRLLPDEVRSRSRDTLHSSAPAGYESSQVVNA